MLPRSGSAADAVTVSEPHTWTPAEQGDAAAPAEQRRIAPARLAMTCPERLAGMLFPLRGGQVMLGRGAAADIPLDDGYVSRAHAVLRGTQTGYIIEDLGSSGGTTVNGRRLTGPHQLRHHDVLRFGPFVEARFEQLVDVDQTIVLPAASDSTMQLAAADVDATRPVGPVPPPATPPAKSAVAFAPPPPPSEMPTSAAAALNTPAPLSAATYHQQVMVERDKALRRAARTRRRAGWLMVAGLILLLAGGATYGWILLRYYTKVDPVTGEHPQTLRLFGDPVNGIPVGKIAFGVAVGGLALLLVGILLRIVAAGRRRRARNLLVPLSAAPGGHTAPPPAPVPTTPTPYGQPPYGQPPYGQPPYGQPPYGRPLHGQPPYAQPPVPRPTIASPNRHSRSRPPTGPRPTRRAARAAHLPADDARSSRTRRAQDGPASDRQLRDSARTRRARLSRAPTPHPASRPDDTGTPTSRTQSRSQQPESERGSGPREWRRR